jgi:hypothetical protein
LTAWKRTLAWSLRGWKLLVGATAVAKEIAKVNWADSAKAREGAVIFLVLMGALALGVILVAAAILGGVLFVGALMAASTTTLLVLIVLLLL